MGLAIIGIIALITILVRRISKETSSLEENLSPGNLLALKIQLTALVTSGLFSILAIIIPQLLSK